MPVTQSESEAAGFAPIAAKSGQAIELSMQQLVLTGRVLPVGARLLVRHSFASAEPKPIEVVYCFALPRDAALRRFRISGEGFCARSELKPVEEAEKTYEEGLEHGHLGALARQYRDGLVNLSVGNLRKGDAVTVWLEILAGVDLRDDGLRFRFPFTLAPSYHAKARSAVVDEAGEMELPEEEFGDVILPGFRPAKEGLHEVGFDLSVEVAAEIAEIGSPSHPVRVGERRNGASRVALAPAAEAPDRDLVLDVRTKQSTVQVLSGEGKDGKGHFAVTVPSATFGEAARTPRSVVFLLDRSGSMMGAPLDQARKALAACLTALEPEDRFGLIAFCDRVKSYSGSLAMATEKERRKAAKFLEGIDIGGGTELAAGIDAAAKLLEKEGGDVFVLTDGQVFATEDVLAKARATGFRIHSLGIGSASQDRFLALLARETGGISRFVTPRERVDTTALDLFASASRPIARGLAAEPLGLAGAVVEPEPPAEVYDGAPLLLFGQCEARASGAIALRWASDSGAAEHRVPVIAGTGAVGDTLRLLRGARLITDIESRMPEPGPSHAADRRRHKRFLERLEKLSLQYGLASRAMALVAVVERPADRPGEPPETRVVPVGLPQDMEFAGVFSLRYHQTAGPMPAQLRFAPKGPSLRLSSVCLSAFEPSMTLGEKTAEVFPDEAETAAAFQEGLIDLAVLLEADGGMPGSDEADRILATLLALLAFAAEDQSAGASPFRAHRKRMIRFLESRLPGPLSAQQAEAAERALQAVSEDRPVEPVWDNAALQTHRNWDLLLENYGGAPPASAAAPAE